MNLEEILKKENIRIDEDRYNVLWYGTMDLTGIKSADDFCNKAFETPEMDLDDHDAITSYSVYKGSEMLYEKLSREEVSDYLKILENKYNKPSLLEQRESILQKEKEAAAKKLKERYEQAYEEYSKILKDEDFKQILKETLVEHGLADLPTGCLCGKNGCLDHKVLQKYFTKEIEDYKAEGIYLSFDWKGALFSLYENKIWSNYSIIKDEKSGKYDTIYHSM